jgi:hypothetical protein
VQALFDENRRKPNLKNRIDEAATARVLAHDQRKSRVMRWNNTPTVRCGSVTSYASKACLFRPLAYAPSGCATIWSASISF